MKITYLRFLFPLRLKLGRSKVVRGAHYRPLLAELLNVRSDVTFFKNSRKSHMLTRLVEGVQESSEVT